MKMYIIARPELASADSVSLNGVEKKNCQIFFNIGVVPFDKKYKVYCFVTQAWSNSNTPPVLKLTCIEILSGLHREYDGDYAYNGVAEYAVEY